MSSSISPVNEYAEWVVSVKSLIRSAQIKASVSVNVEMLRLYWSIGSDVCRKGFETKYGSGFFRNLSAELNREFPGVQGFSERNLRYMRQFYAFYADWASQGNLHQAGADFESLLFAVPWRHQVEIFTRSKSVEEALFFVRKTMENGWSRAMLVNMMDTRMYESQGGIVNNFALTMPKEDSEYAREILRDSYKLDFLTLREDYKERDLHRALEENVTKFLLALGKGFAYVGSHVRFIVNNDEFECDLLFYNLRLRRYIVVELKTVKFRPEFVSKLNFYCNAVNHLMKDEHDKDTIGLLICKEKNDIVAQWTVENSKEPIGISTYELGNIIPLAREVLPSQDELSRVLGGESGGSPCGRDDEFASRR